MIDQGSTVVSDAAAQTSRDKRARSPLRELQQQEVAKQATAALQPHQMSKGQCIDELHRLNAWFGVKPKSCSAMNLAELRDHLEKTLKLKLQPISQYFQMLT